MKKAFTIALNIVFATVVLSCAHSPKMAQSTEGGPVGECKMKATPNSEYVLVSGEEVTPASYQFKIESNVPAEISDFISTLDSTHSPFANTIDQEFELELQFTLPGKQTVTAVLWNPDTRSNFRCSTQLEVKRAELTVSPIASNVVIGEEIPYSLHAVGQQSEITFSVKATEDGRMKAQKGLGEGTIAFQTPGKKEIQFTVSFLHGGKKYSLTSKEKVNVAEGAPFKCAAEIVETGLSAHPEVGDLHEAIVTPKSDPNAAIEITQFNPGPSAYDISIQGNIARWRYRSSGKYAVTGTCKDMATGRLSAIDMPFASLQVAEPLTAAIVSDKVIAVGKKITIGSVPKGGSGSRKITSIATDPEVGLTVVDRSPDQWIIQFNKPSDKPYTIITEVRDELAKPGPCTPPHCFTAPIDIHVVKP